MCNPEPVGAQSEEQILLGAFRIVEEYLAGDGAHMSRGLSGHEAEMIVKNYQERLAREAQAKKIRRRIECGPGKDVSEDTALQRIQGALQDAGNVTHVKIWHGNEAPKNEPGIADILGVYTVNVEDLVRAGIRKVGIALAIEVKGSKTEIRGDQVVFIHKWNQARAIAGIARCAADVDRAIREYGLRGLGAD